MTNILVWLPQVFRFPRLFILMVGHFVCYISAFQLYLAFISMSMLNLCCSSLNTPTQVSFLVAPTLFMLPEVQSQHIVRPWEKVGQRGLNEACKRAHGCNLNKHDKVHYNNIAIALYGWKLFGSKMRPYYCRAIKNECVKMLLAYMTHALIPLNHYIC